MRIKRYLSVVLAILVLSCVFSQAIIPASAANDTVRDTVLILDESGSMGGEPMRRLKEAANEFCDSVLAASGTNRVAVITYSEYAQLICDFTDDAAVLRKAIDDMSTGGMTNMNAALSIADQLLSASSANVKNIVLMSDGIPNKGDRLYDGKYTISDYFDYEYANAIYEQATSLHANYYIYTLGFFHSLWGDDLAFASRFMNDLQNAGYYQVDTVDDLEFTFGEIADDITEAKLTGTFKYPGSFEGLDRDCTATYYYADSYFYNTAKEYNASLATMSLCLAMSAFGSSDVSAYSNTSVNVCSLMDELLFTDIKTTDSFSVKPTTDSIAAAIGQKKIQDNNGNVYTLLAVAIRGGGYEMEWASNLTLGKTGNHKGFAEASNQVIEFIRQYITDTGVEGDVKLWITGYSRAAATANLTAGAIDTDPSLLGDITINNENLYAYCFETPAGLTDQTAINDKETYGNIFNTVNLNDLVTKVAPAAMNFGRYGIDKKLPSREDDADYKDALKAMLLQYEALEGSQPYLVDSFQYYKADFSKLSIYHVFLKKDFTYTTEKYLSVGAFWDDVLDKLVRGGLDRQHYADSVEEGAREVMRLVYSDEQKVEEALCHFMDKVTDINTLAEIVWTGLYDDSKAQKIVTDLLVESFSEAGVTELGSIDDAVKPLVNCILLYAATNFNDVITMFSNDNYKLIGYAHYPELCLAWLQSMDENYTTDAGSSFSSGSCRIIRINCPVDVNVYDMEGTLVASIIGDEALEIEDGLSAYVNSDGEKIFYLPPNGSYEIEMIGTDSGTVNYSINEYSYEAAAVNRVVNYYDVPIEKDRTLHAVVPAYGIKYLDNGTENGTDTVYQLTDMDGKVLTPDLDVAGDEVQNLYYLITAVSENEEYGVVTGSGIRRVGSFAQLTAFANEDCSFEGWYVNGEKVSSDETYRFCVKAELTVIAKFTSNNEPWWLKVSDGWMIVAVILIILLLGGGVTFALLCGRKKEEDSIPDAFAQGQAESDMPREEPITEDAVPKVGVIRVTSGSMQGFCVPINDGETLRLGRDGKTSNLVFSNDYKNVSRCHCSVTYDGVRDSYSVVDWSSNGVYYANRKRLPARIDVEVCSNTALLLADEGCTILLG